jgi:vitamin B12 transporter
MERAKRKAVLMSSRRFVPKLWIFLLSLFFVSTALAEDNVALKEVVVTATRVQESIEDIAQDVTVITKKEIESGSYQNVPEIIKGSVGLNLFEYGNHGAAPSVSLRGSTSEQVLILIDGKRLNKPSDGVCDLNSLNIPPENIERIEILRGASSALYGADAMGGVINIITKIPDKQITKIGTSYGRFSTKNLNASSSGKIKKAGYYVSLLKESSEGFRDNSDYHWDAASTKLTYDFSKDINAAINFDYSSRDAGVPGTLTWPSSSARQKDDNVLFGTSFKVKDTALKLYSHNSKMYYLNPGSEENTHKNNVNGLDLQHSLSIGKSNLLTGGIELISEKLNSQDHITSSASVGKHSRTRKGLFLQDESVLSEYATFIIGARYDDIASEERISPKSSLLFKLPYQINISFSAGKGFRVPTMNSLYWPDTGWAVGNPNLKSEKSTEYEMIVQKFFSDTGRIKFVAFKKESKDLIEWQEVSPWRWSPVNISRAEIKGFETEGKIHLKEADFGLGYTFIDPEDMTTGKKIRYKTRHQLKGTVAVYPFKQTVFSLEGRYISNYVVKDGDPRCHFVLDGKLSKKIKLIDNLDSELFIIGKNILNRNYQTVSDYPMPPVQYTAGMSIIF